MDQQQSQRAFGVRSFWLYPQWLRSHKSLQSQPALFVMAALVGLIGGISASFLKTLTIIVQRALVGTVPTFLDAALRLPWYLKILYPTLGGILAGLVLYLLPKAVQGHGISEIMEAVSIRGGILNLRSALVRSMSSLLSISTGASIGREGPIVQVSAALASNFGQFLKLEKEKLTILVGCGVAAGLAAVYNVPIAASFFVMEIIIGNFAIDIFAPLVISSVVSTLVYRRLFGNDPVYGNPHFTLVSNWELCVYVLLGVLAGIAGAAFRGSLKISEEQFNRLKKPTFITMGIGGLILGLIGLKWPYVWGNGYDAINLILRNEMSFNLIFLLFYLKIFATCISVGSGASGGVFTPTQFIGAALGGFVGFAAHMAFPTYVALPSAYALVGMGCLMAGTTYAPIMAIMMIFEMTLDYEIILPLMLSCIISSVVSRQFHPESIYTEKLRKKGIRFDISLEEKALQSIRVEDVRKEDAPVILANKHFDDVLELFLKSRSNLLYVVDTEGKLLGVIDIHDLKEFFSEKGLQSLVIARDLASTVKVAYPKQSLVEVMDILYVTDSDQIPVVQDEVSRKYLGVITRRDIIGAYNREVLKKKMLGTKFIRRDKEKEGVDYVEMPPGYHIGRILVPAELENKSLGEVNFRSRYRFHVLAIVRTSRDGRSERLMADAGVRLNRGDALIVIGTDEDFDRYESEAQAKE